jgi:hypothetical protein
LNTLYYTNFKFYRIKTEIIRRYLVWKFCLILASVLKLGRPRRRWEDNIKADLRKVGCGTIELINLAKDRDR